MCGPSPVADRGIGPFLLPACVGGRTAPLSAGVAAIAIPSPKKQFILIPKPWQGLILPARLQPKQTCVEVGQGMLLVLCAIWELENSRWKLSLLENKP